MMVQSAKAEKLDLLKPPKQGSASLMQKPESAQESIVIPPFEDYLQTGMSQQTPVNDV